jgi:hypothetical protein
MNDAERYRPQWHFSPRRNWIKDPNRLICLDGEHRLFYQHSPFGDVWAHMSWANIPNSHKAPVWIGWMNIPRERFLRDTPQGTRLLQRPWPAFATGPLFGGSFYRRRCYLRDRAFFIADNARQGVQAFAQNGTITRSTLQVWPLRACMKHND